MNRLDLAFLGRHETPIIVKRSRDIMRNDLSFWRGMLVAFPLALLLWAGLAVIMVAWG